MLCRTLAVFILAFLVVLAGCGAPETAGPEPTARATGSSPTPQQGETPAVAGTAVYEPAGPALVDMSEAGGSRQAEEEQEMEGEGNEAPMPGVRDPLAKLVGQARQALAERLGLAAVDVTVQSTEGVTWPDASLGCPDPEMMYAQVLTPGYRIVLQAGEQTYTYHGNERDQLVLCGQDGRPVR